MSVHLDGCDISIIKAIGFSSSISGEKLVELLRGLGDAELVDALEGLTMMGYVVSEIQSLRTIDDVKKSDFRVNSGYARDIKEAMEPESKGSKKPRRLRRE